MLLQIKAKKGQSLNSTIQALTEFLPEIMGEYRDKFTISDKGGGLMSGGDRHYVGIDLRLPDLSPEVMSEVMPLIRALLALIEHQTSGGISAQIVLGDGKTEKIALISEKNKTSFFDRMMNKNDED